MLRKRWILSVLVLCAFWLGWITSPDDNAKPEYGTLGLPKNCRAYVDKAIAGYRLKEFTAEETMTGLERNCGAGGQIWKDNRR